MSTQDRTFSQDFWGTDKESLFGRNLIDNPANDIVQNIKPRSLGNSKPTLAMFGQNNRYNQKLGEGVYNSPKEYNVGKSATVKRRYNDIDYANYMNYIRRYQDNSSNMLDTYFNF